LSFTELAGGHIDMIKAARSGGDRLTVGTMCSYVPVEILHSFGINPVRIWGQADDLREADGLMQSYICPPVRHLLAMGLEGRYDFLDGIVHCYTCDATCGLYNIWVRNLQPEFSHLISLPYLSIDESRQYALAEFEVLIEKLEALTGRGFSAAGLERSIAIYNEERSLMREVYRLKASGQPVSYTEIYSMNVCSQVLPVELMVERLNAYVEEARRSEPEKDGGRRFLLSGSVITDEPLVAFIEGRGASIVADDTCLGLRVLEGQVAPGPALESLAAYYLTRPPCASRADFPARGSHLLETIAYFDVDAVLFVHQKFCDPHLSDHPFLKKALDEAGIPSTQVELEGEGFTGQVRTRIESFLEVLETQ
jgi:benzoyl-CoA reductase subunit C